MAENNKKIIRPLTDEEMAMATGGTGGNGNPAPKFKVGQHVRVDDCSEYDDMVITGLLWWTAKDGWDYGIKGHMPGIGWLDLGCASERYIHPV